MSRKFTISCLGAIAAMSALLAFTGCSLDFAGGTGVGNPSGNTTVSIIADTGLPRGDSGVKSVILGKPVPITDDSLVLIAQSISIVVQSIYFVLDDGIQADSLLEHYTGHLRPDGENLVLNGPFVFNALDGTCDFGFNTLILPPAKYRGIQLDISNADSTFMGGYSVLLEGDVTVNGAVHAFSINLNNTKDLRPFLSESSAVFINTDDSTEFRLMLNADRWLDNIDLKNDYLNAGMIVPDPITGKITIDKTSNQNMYRDFNHIVRMNIIKSGRLKILSY